MALAELDQIETSPHLRARARIAAGRALARGRALGRAAAGWRVTHLVPGVAGIGLVAAAAGLRFGVWAGLGAAGLFLLRVDSRL